MLRTDDFLYIHNLRPNLWPAGDPEEFRDIDGSPTKSELLERRADPKIAPFFELACAKRPANELYDLKQDPGQIHNVAGRPEYAEAQAKLRAELDRWMQQTADPRARGETDLWDKCDYVGAGSSASGGGNKKPSKK